MNKNMEDIVLVTGGFDPLHSGHINLLNDASKFGIHLYVGLNSDKWLIKKKGFFLLPINERKIIIQNLKMVYKVIVWNDSDNSACGAIDYLLSIKGKKQKLIFANGGDRKRNNIPELERYINNKTVIFKFGVGGYNKKNSSSLIVEKFKKNYLNTKFSV